MKRLTRAGGYTIVEVMLFLLITGVLLASATLVLNGRRQRTEFTQGVREIDAQIRTIVNETASGYYPNQGHIQCVSSNGTGPHLSRGDSTGQGANKGCLFLGRMLQFTAGETYVVYTVVGQQLGANDKEVTSLGQGTDQARQTLITPTPAQSNLPDATASYRLPWGIRVTRIATSQVGGTAIGTFGFIYSFGSYDAEGVNLVSGTTGLNTIVPLANTGLLGDPPDVQPTVTATENMTNSAQNPGKIVICLRSGGGDRQAAIVIGGNNNTTGTEVMIDTVPTECQGA